MKTFNSVLSIFLYVGITLYVLYKLGENKTIDNQDIFLLIFLCCIANAAHLDSK